MLLDFMLSAFFEYHQFEEANGYWCDGIFISELDPQRTKKHVNDKRRIVTQAWIGKDGQDKYRMIILFGKYSLRRYAKGSSVVDCIPDNKSMDWIEMDFPAMPVEHSAYVMPQLVKSLCCGGIIRAVSKNQTNFLVEIQTEHALRGLKPDLVQMNKLPDQGVNATAPAAGDDCDIDSRY